MPITELDPEELHTVAEAMPEDTPVVMLNLLRFHDQARYGPGDSFAPCSGFEAYVERYVPAFNRIAPEYGAIRPVFVGAARHLLVGPAGEQWDMAALIEYPIYKAMVALLDDPRYRDDAEPHRVAALADWRFLVTTQLTM